MPELGVSIYPSKSSYSEMADFLKRAAYIGYKRIFTSLLEVADNPQETVGAFKKIIDFGNELGMKTSIDVNPQLFERLEISYKDLSFFKALGVWSVRLDEGFTGQEEAEMTRNPYHLKIEINSSRGQHYVDMILDFKANRDNLIGCHNFYPQKYTALDFEYFLTTSKQYKNHYLKTAAFVDTPSGGIGPWPVSNLMVTTEIQRDMSLTSQIHLLKLSGLIDDIFISSSLVSQNDLEDAWQAFTAPVPEFLIEVEGQISPLEYQILCDDSHSYRGDYSSYMIRSCRPRMAYKDSIIEKAYTPPLKRGDVTICNQSAGQYKGELQIALRDRENDGSHNIVARIAPKDSILLNYLSPWQTFRFRIS